MMQPFLNEDIIKRFQSASAHSIQNLQAIPRDLWRKVH